MRAPLSCLPREAPALVGCLVPVTVLCCQAGTGGASRLYAVCAGYGCLSAAALSNKCVLVPWLTSWPQACRLCRASTNLLHLSFTPWQPNSTASHRCPALHCSLSLAPFAVLPCLGSCRPPCVYVHVVKRHAGCMQLWRPVLVSADLWSLPPACLWSPCGSST